MTEDHRKMKEEIFGKISSLIKMAEALGVASDDDQTIFVSESLKIVLQAGSQPNSATLLTDHLVNFIDDWNMLSGNVEAVEHLRDKPVSAN